MAQVTRARGNRGEVAAIPWTSRPERLAELKEVALFGPGWREGERREIESAWAHGDRWVFKFRGVNSIAEAERYAQCEVRIPRSDRAALPEGEYYYSDLIGCELIDRSTGESLGRVTDWHEYGGPGLLEADGLLIPFARSICSEIDVDGRRILVNLPEGLRDLKR